MKKMNVLLLIIGFTFMSVGVSGYVFAGENINDVTYGYGMMNHRWADDYESENQDYWNEGCYNDGFRMSGRYNNSSSVDYTEKYELDELTEEVEEYIDGYDIELIIDDIFVFEDTEYYYLIIKEDTGKGAMELLINPYTKDVYWDHGPNMMWNLKYGMHYTGSMMGGRDMMRGRGMMGYYVDEDYYYNDYYNKDYSEDNEISSEEAYNEGVAYLEEFTDEITLGSDFHEFYGYYTYHVEEDGETIGMLSVNGFTGDVWYHDWHGELVEVISGHDD